MEESVDLGVVRATVVRDLERLPLPELDTVRTLARAYARYRDSSFPERNCDNCRKPYKGPAVYCCLGCALADSG